jgi:hypothetical protein
MTEAGRVVDVVKGSDDDGGRGGGWDMRVLLFGRARTRCTKPHWDQFCVPLRRLFSNWERQGVVQCWTGRQEWGTASSVAA